MYRYLQGGFLLCALAVALAACNRGPEAPPPPCPEILVPADTNELTQFAPGPGRDLTDIVFEAKVAGFGGFCETDIDDDRTGEIEVDLNLRFEVVRGPANTSRTATLSYFVAIADTDDNILKRAVFESPVAFEGNRHRVALREELRQVIPLAAGRTGEDFVIYVGMQLTEEQLDYNHSTRARP